jgi:hypothetical protein
MNMLEAGARDTKDKGRTTKIVKLKDRILDGKQA